MFNKKQKRLNKKTAGLVACTFAQSVLVQLLFLRFTNDSLENVGR